MKKILLFLSLMTGFTSLLCAENYADRHGWPEQKVPQKLIVCKPCASIQENMLAESLSGLAAQAVNEGRYKTMVWMTTNNPQYRSILENTIDVLHINEVEIMDVWTLAKHLKKDGVVKGYILYNQDAPRENPYASNPGTDYSVNTATVYASLMKGALVDESLRQQAEKAGLKCLMDAREKDLAECFAENKDKLNNHSALSIPPSVHNLRDYAIAHKLMLYDDRKELIDDVLEWVEPLSPILGWGCGDEFDFTSVIARWGHYNTATNWCMNLPFISSASGMVELKKLDEKNLEEIDFNKRGGFHSFVMSDGDNIQWSMSDYQASTLYMSAGPAVDAGISWTSNLSLSIISPFTWNAFADYQRANETTFIEYGGGYEYPDQFASERPNREELLREFARRVNLQMEKLGIKVFGFICRDVSSPDAMEAYKIFAEEMPGITGMMAVQYAPYELEGQIYWVKNKAGVDIPVMTSRYSIWNEINETLRPRAGTPEFVASLINRDEMKDTEDNILSWTIVHAWSDFSKSSKVTELPAIGYNPTKAAKELLVDEINTVSANELLWRVRMKYRPEQTKTMLNK